MMSPDLQRVAHIYDYCNEIRNTIERYGNDYSVFDTDPDYQRSIFVTLSRDCYNNYLFGTPLGVVLQGVKA